MLSIEVNEIMEVKQSEAVSRAGSLAISSAGKFYKTKPGHTLRSFYKMTCLYQICFNVLSKPYNLRRHITTVHQHTSSHIKFLY
jgi:hypothetical protein